MRILLLLTCLLFTSCAMHRVRDQSGVLSSIQCIDRNGLSETISNTQRLNNFRSTDFMAAQPYKKVLRVYGRNQQGQCPTKITTYHDNGHIWQYLEALDGRAHGAYAEWHPNGSKKLEAQVIEGVPELNDNAILSWVFDGVSHVWDADGHLAAEIAYDKGLLHGESTYYFPNGEVHKRIPYDSGKIDGALCAYDAGGNLVEEIPYVGGEKEGVAVKYWDAHSVCSIEEYVQDRLERGVYFDKTGALCAEIVEGNGERAEFEDALLSALVEYKAGKPEGRVRTFYPSGVLHTCYALHEGKKEGEEWEYYPESDQPKLLLHWHADRLQGTVKTWFPNGVQESQWEMEGNRRQGLAFAWYHNGDLMLSEEYESDLLVKGTYYRRGEGAPTSRVEEGKGRATLFSAEGLLLKKVDYDKGKPTLHHG